MPFDKVTEMMREMVSVQTNPETVRRLTEQIGSWIEAAQIAEIDADSEPELEEKLPLQRCVFSADGAMISLVHKQWVETRTVAIGEPQEKLGTKARKRDPCWQALVFFTAGGRLNLYQSGRSGDTAAQGEGSKGSLCRHGWGRLVSTVYREAST